MTDGFDHFDLKYCVSGPCLPGLHCKPLSRYISIAIVALSSYQLVRHLETWSYRYNCIILSVGITLATVHLYGLHRLSPKLVRPLFWGLVFYILYRLLSLAVLVVTVARGKEGYQTHIFNFYEKLMVETVEIQEEIDFHRDARPGRIRELLLDICSLFCLVWSTYIIHRSQQYVQDFDHHRRTTGAIAVHVQAVRPKPQ